MRSPDPPYLRTIRIGLAVLHLAGIAAIFLPFTYDVSVWWFLLFEPMLVEEFITSTVSWRDVGQLLMAITVVPPFFAPLLIWTAQARALFKWPLRRWERGLGGTVSGVLGASALACLGVFTLWMIADFREWNSGNEQWAVVAAIIAGWAGCIFAGLPLWMHWKRASARPLLWMAWARSSYVMHAILVGVFFGVSVGLDGGGWLCGGVALLYAAETTIFLIYGRRDRSGTAAHAFLRYWLPTPEADPRPDAPICVKCGYDLRGTIPAGGRVCPECGTAVA